MTTKTPPNIDLVKLCPELAELMELIEPKASKGDKASVFFFLRYKRIAATMLAQQEKIDKLAADMRRIKKKCVTVRRALIESVANYDRAFKNISEIEKITAHDR